MTKLIAAISFLFIFSPFAALSQELDIVEGDEPIILSPPKPPPVVEKIEKEVKPVNPNIAVLRKAAQSAEAATKQHEMMDRAKIIDKSSYCLDCHKRETPGIVNQWLDSAHASIGVGCNDCHEARKSDKDGFLHADRYYISSVVTPADCAKCHEHAMKQYLGSGHAEALTNLEKMKEDDPRYPLMAQYRETGFSECSGCHGTRVKIDAEGRPDPATWPNSGTGRINPDDSKGNCTICHGKHRCSLESARRPSACLGCHDGKNYPEGSIYLHSAHGRVYDDIGRGEDLGRPGFFCDTSQFTAPTCALCHMNGAGRNLVSRHDPGWRLPHDLTHPQAPAFEGNKVKMFRQNMKEVCSQCHASSVIDRFFEQADQRLEVFQQEKVEPALADFQARLAAAGDGEKEEIMAEYSEFLATAKAYRLNLYMGAHGRIDR